MEHRTWNLLDEALGLAAASRREGSETASPAASRALNGEVIAIEDCVETSGAFLLHHLIKRAFLSSSGDVIIFLAFSHPFSHYDRILRKLGCNLVAQKEKGRFFFFDLLTFQCPGGREEKEGKGGLVELYGKILKTISSLTEGGKKRVTIMIDDLSLMEVAAHGDSDHVLDFLHYCRTLTSEIGCCLITLNHEDVYSTMERPTFVLQMEYFSDVLIKAEPLATGLAADVHGQLTILNKVAKGSLKNKISNLHFRVKENGFEYFYPGSRT